MEQGQNSTSPRPFPESGAGCGSVDARWYCAQTLQQQEHRALTELSKQKYRTWLPQIATGPLDKTAIRVMFPGYLFVQFDITADRWRPICSTYGVRRLFGPTPERPTPVRAGVIEALMARGRAGDGVYDDRIAAPSLVGLSGTLTAGPFSGFEGVCRMSTDQRVAVMITMFGREVKVEAARAEFKVQAA